MLESLLKRIPWQQGRQMTGYNKLCLFSSKLLMCDAYPDIATRLRDEIVRVTELPDKTLKSFNFYSDPRI